MFSNAFRQKERTGKYGTARDQYLQALFASSPSSSLCLSWRFSTEFWFSVLRESAFRCGKLLTSDVKYMSFV
jgi:hypothetical protein